MDDAYERLAIGIVEQAVRDYARAQNILHQDLQNEVAQRTKAEIEQFFGSHWLAVLTNIPGNVLIGYGMALAEEGIKQPARSSFEQERRG